MTEPEAHGVAVRISIGLLIVTACLGRTKSHKHRRSYIHFLQNNDYKFYTSTHVHMYIFLQNNDYKFYYSLFRKGRVTRAQTNIYVQIHLIHSLIGPMKKSMKIMNPHFSMIECLAFI